MCIYVMYYILNFILLKTVECLENEAFIKKFRQKLYCLERDKLMKKLIFERIYFLRLHESQ